MQTPDLNNLPVKQITAIHGETVQANPKKVESYKLPTIAELFEDVEEAEKLEGLNAILNTPPPKKWIKEHPYIKVDRIDSNGNRIKEPYRYLPIDKVEYLLRKIFKRYRIEIKNQGTAFNGVWVTVRVSYFNPIINDFEWQEGIGAIHLQVKSGSSPADLANINNGALSMAFPLAKTLAIKDACELIGDIFGSNISRNDTISFTVDQDIITREEKRKQKLMANGIDVK